MTDTVQYHPFQGTRISLMTPAGVQLIESGLAGFSNEQSEDLAFPFESLADIPSVYHTVVVDLPYDEMVRGTGKGYVLDMIDFMREELNLPISRMFKIDLPFWGAPIQDQRLFLVGTQKEVSVTVPEKGITLGEVLPDVAFHAPSVQRRNMLYPGFYSMFGYVNSATATLPPASEWKDKYPMCEKRVGETLKVSRLSKHDVEALWGYVPLSDKPAELSRVTPAKVLQTFLDSLTTIDKK